MCVTCAYGGQSHLKLKGEVFIPLVMGISKLHLIDEVAHDYYEQFHHPGVKSDMVLG